MKVHNAALNALKDGAITQKACDYLAHWAQGTQHRLPRLAQYTCLNHRVNLNREAPHLIHTYRQRGWGCTPRPVLVAAVGNDGEVLPVEAELDDDADGDKLVIEPQLEL